MDKRIIVGLLIHHLENDYSKAIVKGAAEAAETLGVDIVFIPGRSFGGDYFDRKHTVYEYQNNVLYNYVSPKVMDGIVVSAATIGQFMSKEEFKSFIDGYEGMPVLTLENEVRGYPCIHFGSDGIKQVVNHLVEEHGCRNIGFVSGPKNNKDAEMRLDAFRTAMAEHDLECGENHIVYGNFSEYSEKVVSELLDKCENKLDAICFANDQMCIGGYNALKERGLTPGKDIIVTGYDDSEVAKSLSPMLTTVKADASLLGYISVIRLVEWIKTGKQPKNEEVSSGLVIRNSCGCELMSNDSNRLKEIISGMSPEEAARTIVNIITGPDITYSGNIMRDRIISFISKLFTVTASGGEIPSSEFVREFDLFLTDGVTEDIGYDTMATILDITQKSCLSLLGASHTNLHVKQLRIAELFERFNRQVTDFTIGWYYKNQADNAACSLLISNIARDMIMYMEDEEQCFYSIINNMSRIHIRSSYIYVYPKAVINPPNSQWVNPEKLLLKAYHNGDDLVTLTGKEQYIPTWDYLENQYTEPDRQRNMVLYPLYSNEEQYGLLLCDVPTEYFHYIYSSAPQICTAIKLTGLVKRLEGSLNDIKNTNTMLSKISMSDELTGVYNRRGFYTYANELIRSEKSIGHTAALIFGDLDNLKKINDTFGHDEGDYAIKTAAEYLKNGLRETDIVARIGGDEFAALTIVTSDMRDLTETLPRRIKELAEKHNRESDKPYNVCMSVGVYTFTCGADTEIRDFMDRADTALYKDKKNKDADVMKKK